MNPELMIATVFAGVAIGIFCVGRLMMGVRNELPGTGPRRPLALGNLTLGLAGVIPTGETKRDKLKNILVKAGYYGRYAVDEFLALRNAAMVAWLIGIALIVATLVKPDQDLLPIGIVTLVGLLVLYSLPMITITLQSRRRVDQIKHALPDALDLINMMVTGGLPLAQAIKRASGELKSSHPQVACEMAIINHQASAGSLRQALEQFGLRIDEPEVVSLSTLVQHADQLGGNIAGAFADFSDSIRRSRRQRAEERGNKASIKLLFPVIFFLAPPIYILLLGPAMLEMRDFVVRQNQAGGVLDQSSRVEMTQQLNDSRDSVENAP